LARLKFPTLALGYRCTEFVPTWRNFSGDHRTPYRHAFVEKTHVDCKSLGDWVAVFHVLPSMTLASRHIVPS
jgi:hypothetical protein